MNRYDERGPRFWRQGRDRDERFRDEDYRFESGEESGRTAGDPDRQPFSGNPYGYQPGQGHGYRPGQDPGRSRREWGGRWRDSESNRGATDSVRGPASGEGERWSQRYGQREPYNAHGGSRRSRWGGPWQQDEGSRYSESQYGTRRAGFDPYGDRYEPEFGEGPFADTSESPSYFGTGHYGDGGASYTGGFDQRSRTPYPGSLGEDTFASNFQGRQRRYRTGPKGYTRSDERIREDISERLMLADSIDSSEVTVSVKEGRVTLEGTVPTRSMKHAIEDLADYTAGVTDVDNRVRVQRQDWDAGRSATSAGGASGTGIQTASGVTPTSGGSRTTKQ